MPDTAAYRRRRISTIWIVPILAVIIVGWMAFESWHKSGPTVHITFQSTDGVEANRTLIRHKGVVLGTVASVAPSDDFSHVIVTARMAAAAAPYLNQETKFWVVHPRISVGAISDLNTLVSGVYIELSPGEGGKTRDFTGLDEPLAVDQSAIGKNFTLNAPQLGSLERGSPLYFHGIAVGEVTSIELGEDKSVLIHIFIRSPYDKLVLAQTRFWNVSGIGVTAGPEGFKIAAQSLQAVIQGGIAFDVPDGLDGGAEAQNGAVYAVYPDRDIAEDSVYTKKISYLLRFAGSAKGLDVGGGVDLLGNRVGSIAATHIDIDENSGEATSVVTVDIQPERMHLQGNRGGSLENRARAAFRQMAKRNLRAQVEAGNLLTGQRSINFDFVPTAPPASIIDGDPYPQFPTLPPNDIDAVMRDTRALLQDSDKVVREVGPQIGPLLGSLKTTSDQINTGDGSSGGLSGTLYELKQAAQSVRALADYLDAHPESILRGKQGSNP